MNNILLLGKRIISDRSPVIMRCMPDAKWKDLWEDNLGCWEYNDGCLIGTQKGNSGGILISRESFSDDVMLCFTMSSVPPATRDLNAIFCAEWDYDKNYLASGYICGLNGWYDNKSGIEKFPENGLKSLTSLYKYEPGREVRICTGAIRGHCFLTVDDVLVSELIDDRSIRGGRVGFSPYCTRLAVHDIEVRKICWETITQQYEPEF